MNKKLKWAFIAFIFMLLISLAPKQPIAQATGKIYYIKNNYTQGAYLYEESGVLRYGIPLEGDTSFQWNIEEQDTYKIIRNLATGNSITMEGHGDESVEGNWGEVINCQALEDGKDTYLWEFEIGEGQNILSAGKSYSGFALHLESATAGRPFAQKIGGDQLAWGNMKWDFVETEQVDFEAMNQSGFCIQNAAFGSYLRVDNGALTHGVPDGKDDAYIWEVERMPDGTKAVKNKLTAQYLSMGNYDKSSLTLELGDYSEKNSLLHWNLQLSKYTTILSADSDYMNYGLYLDPASRNNVRSRDILSKGEELADGMKWNFIPSSNVAEVSGDLVLGEGIYNLKNSYYYLYLIEDKGKAVYGNAKASDQNAQWRFAYDKETGYTALMNVESGKYLHANADNGQLTFSTSPIFHWKLKRNMNKDYPGAVVFQDSIRADSYLHMESLNGFAEDSNGVQPTWGTPHWEPILFKEEEASQGEVSALTLPENYIRLYCKSREGEYLYENSSGAVIYKECNASDARSHWKLVAGDQRGVYYLQNRETEGFVTNKGNGTLRCVPLDQVTEGSIWEISQGMDKNQLILSNYDPEVPSYLRPYINIQKFSGFAQSNLVSIEEETTNWIYEEAQMETSTVEEQEAEQVPLNALMDSNQYKLLYNGEYLPATYRLEYYGNQVHILDVTENTYHYYDEGWVQKTTDDMADRAIQWEAITKAGIRYLRQGDNRVQLEVIPSDAYYSADQAHTYGDKLVFTVFAREKGNYEVTVDYQGKSISSSYEINGTSPGDVRLPMKDRLTLALNQGINTITLSKVAGMNGITIHNSENKSYRGASLNYTSYEAEDCNTTGTIIDENREYHEFSSEASGRQAVSLDGTGKYIKITLTQAANAFVMRYCIPDSLDGSGIEETLNLYIDGHKTQSITLTSKHSWVYGTYPWTNQPTDGQPHHFYDEVSIKLDQTYPAGTVIKLQKDAANYAEYYMIDVVEAELIPTANERPENSLSITDFGAVAGDGQDDSKAFYNCMAEAVKQGKEIWIPEGIFDISNPTSDYDLGDQQDKNRGIVIKENNVTIRGAGMWHSILQGDYAAFFVKASNISFYDFSLRGTATSRRDAIDPSAIESDYNTHNMKNLTVQNIWIQHYKTGIWTHNMDGMYVVGCRIRDTYADGMNLRKGSSNAVVEQCDVRNTGDDAIALWSSYASNANVKIRFNTVRLQWLANNIAVYGGTDIQITDNLIMDTVVNGAGINISSNFDPKPFAGRITIARNTMLRCGSQDYNNNQYNGAIWFNTIQGNDNHAIVNLMDNLILDSSYQGISFSNRGTISNVILEGNTIIGCGSYGIDVLNGVKGFITAKNNLIGDTMLDAINNGSSNSMSLNVEITQGNEKKEEEPLETIGNTTKKNKLLLPLVTLLFITLIAVAAYILWRIRKGSEKK